ncbi:MAG: hypothetical protein R8F63_14505 [Acidimicrobiales bacterium]|nr:hypothetical protein [Acidimicrobiales bacterium]
MPTLTVLTPEGAATVSGVAADGRATLAAADLPAAIGWELKPEGLCRGDACVPVRGIDGEEVDLGAVVAALGSSLLVDDETGTVAISVAATDRRAALAGRQAPDFTLPDLDGRAHSLDEFAGRKRLLIAFASW